MFFILHIRHSTPHKNYQKHVGQIPLAIVTRELYGYVKLCYVACVPHYCTMCHSSCIFTCTFTHIHTHSHTLHMHAHTHTYTHSLTHTISDKWTVPQLGTSQKGIWTANELWSHPGSKSHQGMCSTEFIFKDEGKLGSSGTVLIVHIWVLTKGFLHRFSVIPLLMPWYMVNILIQWKHLSDVLNDYLTYWMHDLLKNVIKESQI